MRRQIWMHSLLITSALIVAPIVHTVSAASSSTIAEARKDLKANQALSDLSRAFRDVATAVEPSVVHIEVKAKRHARNMRQRMLPPGFKLPPEFDREVHPYDVPRRIGAGSGWVYDDQGHIITNHHVVRHAEVIHVRFNDETAYTATVVGTDPSTDIAVLKIDASTLHAAEMTLQAVEQGDIVFAFGSPLQYEFSMSQGIVSGKGRRMGLLGPTGYENFIQTDAAINPGNSGGPLVNIHGQVVGMNTAIASRNGMFNGVGFAIPAKMIHEVAEQLISDGKVSRGYLGVVIQDDADLVRSFGYDGPAVVIGDVQPDMPGAKAGLKRGDIVTQVDGLSVTTSDELRRAIAHVRPGAVTTLTIWRGGKEVAIDVTLAEMPASVRGKRADPEDQPIESLTKLGLNDIATMTKDLAKQTKVAFHRGVLIQSVRPGSAAAAVGLKPGLIITEVNGEATHDIDALVKAIGDDSGGELYRLTIQSERGSYFVVLKM